MGKRQNIEGIVPLLSFLFFECFQSLFVCLYEYYILCSPGCPRTCAVDKAYLGLKESLLSRLRLCYTIPSLEDDRPQLNCLQIID